MQCGKAGEIALHAQWSVVAPHAASHRPHASVRFLPSAAQDEAQLDEKKVYRQTTMFSATMPLKVEMLAKKYLRHPVFINIGDRKASCLDLPLLWPRLRSGFSAGCFGARLPAPFVASFALCAHLARCVCSRVQGKVNTNVTQVVEMIPEARKKQRLLELLSQDGPCSLPFCLSPILSSYSCSAVSSPILSSSDPALLCALQSRQSLCSPTRRRLATPSPSTSVSLESSAPCRPRSWLHVVAFFLQSLAVSLSLCCTVARCRTSARPTSNNSRSAVKPLLALLGFETYSCSLWLVLHCRAARSMCWWPRTSWVVVSISAECSTCVHRASCLVLSSSLDFALLFVRLSTTTCRRTSRSTSIASAVPVAPARPVSPPHSSPKGYAAALRSSSRLVAPCCDFVCCCCACCCGWYDLVFPAGSLTFSSCCSAGHAHHVRPGANAQERQHGRAAGARAQRGLQEQARVRRGAQKEADDSVCKEMRPRFRLRCAALSVMLLLCCGHARAGVYVVHQTARIRQ